MKKNRIPDLFPPSWLLLTALSLLIGFSVYEIFMHITFLPEHMWDPGVLPVDPRTLVNAVCSLVCIVTIFAISDKFFKTNALFIIAIPLIIIISGNGAALLAVLIFVLACTGLGMAVYNRFFGTKNNQHRNIAEYLALSFFIGMCSNAMLIWGSLHFKVNYNYAYYLFFLAEILVSKSLLLNLFAQARNKYETGKKFDLTAGQKIIIIYALFTLAYVLVPLYGFDDLHKHLYVPKYVSLFARFHFDPRWFFALDTAIAPQSSYASVFLLGGEYAIRLLNYFIIFACFFLTEDFSRRTFNARVSIFAALTLMLTPFLLWAIGEPFIDSFVFLASILLTINIFHLFDSPAETNTVLFFLICAFALMCKQAALPLIIPFAVILVFMLGKRFVETKNYSIPLYFFLGSALFIALISPLLIHNYIISGNPIYPFYNAFFKSEYFAVKDFKDTRWIQPLNWKTLYDMTFNGSKYLENMNYSMGISFFVFLFFSPLLFINKEYKRFRKIFFSFFIAVLGYVILLQKGSGLYMRYFICALFILSILMGSIIDTIFIYCRENKVTRRLLIFFISIVFATNLFCGFGILHIASPYPLTEPFTKNYENTNLYNDQQIRKVFKFASLIYGKNSKGLLVDSPASYFADFNIENAYFHYYQNETMLHSLSNAQDAFNKIFVERAFDFIIMPDNSSLPLLNSPEFKWMLYRAYSAGGLSLYVPKMPMRQYEK